MTVRIGCCGFPVARKRYFEAFDTVEVQQTFYEPPGVTLLMKWRGEAPAGFEYAVKAWQLITHDPKSPTYRRLRTGIPKAGSGATARSSPRTRSSRRGEGRKRRRTYLAPG